MMNLLAGIVLAGSLVVPTPQLSEAPKVSHSVVSSSLALKGMSRYHSRKLDRVARCESGRNPRALSRSGRYRGAFQFSLSTWHSVGGHGDPRNYSYGYQKLKAYKLVRRSGGSYRAWPICGRR